MGISLSLHEQPSPEVATPDATQPRTQQDGPYTHRRHPAGEDGTPSLKPLTMFFVGFCFVLAHAG